MFYATGQTSENVAGASRVMSAMGWCLPAALLFAAGASFLEAHGKPLPGMMAVIAANLLNIFLNWILIFGHLDAEQLGATGSAYATSVARWFAVVLVFGYIWRRMDHAKCGLTGALPEARDIGRRLRSVGWPLSAAHGLETAAFSVMTIFAAWAGVAHIAMYQVTINMMGLVFMVALGLEGAGSVRVGRAVGRGASDEVRLAGITATTIGLCLSLVFSLLMFALPETLTGIYTRDAQVLSLAVATLSVAAFATFADCAHGVTMGALRGTGDVWPATMTYLFSCWCVMLPLGYILAIDRQLGAPGLVMAVAGGAALAAVLLGVRFYLLSGRVIARR